MHIFCIIFYVIIFRASSFMLSFDVIIFHGQQMLSFLCYHFPLYIFCVIIYVIIWCYHLLLSFPPFFLFPENVTHSQPHSILHKISADICQFSLRYPQFRGYLSVYFNVTSKVSRIYFGYPSSSPLASCILQKRM